MSVNIEEDVRFIKEDLLPNMVYDRCFCEVGSREFVEFDSAFVDPDPQEVKVPLDGVICYKYNANLTINFSGQPISFPIVIKLVPKDVEDSNSFGYFLMEEYFYTKMLNKYSKDLFPKCYLSNLGKYGRPVIVLEDLLENGFHQFDHNLSPVDKKLCLHKIAEFHASGMRLKKEEPEIFREFENNIHQAEFSEEEAAEYNQLLLEQLTELNFSADEIKTKLKDCPLDGLRNYNDRKSNLHTICHGNLRFPNLFYKRKADDSVEIKFENFEHMKISSIGLHLATYLLLNDITMQFSEDDVNEYIGSYLQEMQRVYPEITAETLKKDIDEALLYSYVNVLMINS